MKTKRKKNEVENQQSEPITVWNGDTFKNAEIEYNVHYEDGSYRNTFSSKEDALEIAARCNGYVRIVIIADLIK